MTVEEVSYGSAWSREEDIAFERALANYYTDESDEKWEKIAADVPGKSVEQIKEHYELLVEDVGRIESGCVPLPSYPSTLEDDAGGDDGGGSSKKGGGGNNSHDQGSKAKADQERRKGIAWSEDEHRLFLLGLDKYGKGDWRSISRNFVVTRTPTQVASHAQKYFIRLNSMNKDRRRSSIHDITSVGDAADVSTPQGPITGQNSNNTTGSAAVAVAGGGNKPAKQAASQPPPGPPVYGRTPTTIGQPVGGPLVSAVGTPVNLPAPPHMAYGVHAAPVPGSVAPMNMAQMPYTLPRTPTAHR